MYVSVAQVCTPILHYTERKGIVVQRCIEKTKYRVLQLQLIGIDQLKNVHVLWDGFIVFQGDSKKIEEGILLL